MGYSGFGNLSSETQQIVDNHKNDFNSETCKAYIKSKGGYKAYVRSLGGVFEKYADFTGIIGTRKQLYDCAEYVWGLYAIWGVDYSNGSSFPNGNWNENRWKAYAGYESAFYSSYEPSKRFKRNYASEGFGNDNDYPGIDRMLNPVNNYYAITNCALGVVHVLKKAGLCGQNMVDPSEHAKTWKNQGYDYKIIKNQKDLKAGDILIFSKSLITNKASMTEIPNWWGKYFHTSIVGKVEDGRIYQFDSGHAYTQYGQGLHVTTVGQQLYPFATDWIALRFDITDKLKTDGWAFYDSSWHYYKDGKLLKGFHELPWKDEVNWYYFNENGEYVKAWQFLSRNGRKGWFFFNDKGVMQTGLQYLRWKDSKYFYYFGEDGMQVHGTVSVTFGQDGKYIAP